MTSLKTYLAAAALLFAAGPSGCVDDRDRRAPGSGVPNESGQVPGVSPGNTPGETGFPGRDDAVSPPWWDGLPGRG